MPFEVAYPKSYAGTPAVPRDGVVVSSRRPPKGEGIYLYFEIGTELAGRLALDDESQVEIAWGQGCDIGKLRVRKAPAGQRAFKVKSKPRGHYAFAVSVLPDWINDDARVKGLKVGSEVLPDRALGAHAVYLTLPRALIYAHTRATA